MQARNRKICLAPLALTLGQALCAETFVVLDSQGRISSQPAGGARARFTPCSTFKIPNSLIALDSGVAPDAAFSVPYDPVRDGEQHGAWSLDQDLRSALRVSAAWYYREIARRVGVERMRGYLDRFDYGNRDMGGGIDGFWIGGGLAISPEEQVRFLQRFRENKLGVDLRKTQMVRELLLLESGDTYRWFGKTGTCVDRTHGPVAWHVGFVERGAAVTYYALQMSGGSVAELFRKRPAVIRGKLSQAGLVDAEPPSPVSQMKTRIGSVLSAFPGTVHIAAKNLDTGQSFAIRGNELVRTASTIKLPIMAGVFAAQARGMVRWEDTVELQEDDKVSGSGVLAEFSPGVRLPLRDLMRLMIVVSDNTATNLVLGRVPADFVNAELDKLGLTRTRALRKVLGSGGPAGVSREGSREEFRRFGLGVSTPREMITLIEKLARREVVSPDASREMLAVLGRQQYKDGIGRRLPYTDVASKSGSLDRLRSDVGLVQSAGGRVAIAITVDDMLRTDYSAENAGNVLISDLTGMLLEGLSVPVSYLERPERVVELKAAMDHVQGIEVEGTRAWVTWVDRKKQTGHLGEFDLTTGRMVRSVDVHKGARFHPSGLSGDGESLWLAIAEYKPGSSASVQRWSKRNLKLESEWEIADHIGAVAVNGHRVYGANWDAREIYIWDRAGKLIERRDNTAGTRYQDVKFAAGQLVASGLRGGEGAIDWLDPSDFRLVRRIRTGKTNRAVVYTHEGMAISGDRLYLMPEDAPTRVFVFRLP
jgi:beta-lactamase class D